MRPLPPFVPGSQSYRRGRLVVAANDGVMPQTIEALNHAKAAQVPIIVAINKTDLTTANPERVKQELTEHGLVVEEWGGDTIAVNVSALQGEGIDELLEMILLVAEVEDLKANPHCPARGTVIDAKLDKGRGPVATVLLATGTLRVGDAFAVGNVCGKVRALINDQGESIKEAGPSTPVEVLGISDVPEAGDLFVVVKDEQTARQVASIQSEKRRDRELSRFSRVTLDDLFQRIQEGEVKELNLVIKADVQGSAEAVRASLEKLSTDEVRVRVIHQGVGAISESDVLLATASDAVIIGFNVRLNQMSQGSGARWGGYSSLPHYLQPLGRCEIGHGGPARSRVQRGDIGQSPIAANVQNSRRRHRRQLCPGRQDYPFFRGSSPAG